MRPEQPEEKPLLRTDFVWVANPAAIGFYALLFLHGILYGAMDAFFSIYVDEDFHVSKGFLGKESHYSDNMLAQDLYLYMRPPSVLPFNF